MRVHQLTKVWIIHISWNLICGKKVFEFLEWSTFIHHLPRSVIGMEHWFRRDRNSALFNRESPSLSRFRNTDFIWSFCCNRVDYVVIRIEIAYIDLICLSCQRISSTELMTSIESLLHWAWTLNDRYQNRAFFWLLHVLLVETFPCSIPVEIEFHYDFRFFVSFLQNRKCLIEVTKEILLWICRCCDCTSKPGGIALWYEGLFLFPQRCNRGDHRSVACRF